LSLFLSLMMALQIHTAAPPALIVTQNGETIIEVNRSDFESSPYPEYLIDQKKLDELLNSVNKQISTEPINASLNEHGQIVSEKNGQKLDTVGFKRNFYEAFYKNSTASMEAPLQNVYPKVDSELLERIKRKRISHYVTYFNNRNKERVHNIKLASEAINNHVVFPGETFSFNRVVGKRTVSKGYLPAPVIVKGELTEGVGGGICQVSSTLFNAVDRAGVRILERYSHSRRVPYVPPKRDATVSWYGPDFTFKNQHNQPLLIRSSVFGGQMIIMVFSSEDIDFNRKDIPSAPPQVPKEINTIN
jgi:vancomycin resistance protein YoaR